LSCFVKSSELLCGIQLKLAVQYLKTIKNGKRQAALKLGVKKYSILTQIRNHKYTLFGTV